MRMECHERLVKRERESGMKDESKGKFQQNSTSMILKNHKLKPCLEGRRFAKD
jgi:hypothetical protein